MDISMNANAAIRAARLGAGLIALLSASCTPSSPPSGAAGALTAAVDVPGYSHSFEHSRFATGSTVDTRREFGMTKRVGPLGVFATLDATGWSAGLPNADAPARSATPIPSASEHNSAVVDYFVKAGLPADQIDRVNAGATMATSTSVSANFESSPPTLVHYTSTIYRKVAGFPVVESFAVATINAQRDVIEESVYWPPVPSSVIADAQNISSVASDPARFKATFASLPTSVTDARVAIHHTPCVGGTAEMRATYDVIDAPKGGHSRIRHFSLDGKEVILAVEARLPASDNVLKQIPGSAPLP